MTGIQPGTQDIIDGDTAAQTQQTLDNIRTSLVAANATMAHVDECTVFLTNMADYAAMNKVYQAFFPQTPPARATLAVTALPRPAARVEIKCSATLRSGAALVRFASVAGGVGKDQRSAITVRRSAIDR